MFMSNQQRCRQPDEVITYQWRWYLLAFDLGKQNEKDIFFGITPYEVRKVLRDCSYKILEVSPLLFFLKSLFLSLPFFILPLSGYFIFMIHQKAENTRNKNYYAYIMIGNYIYTNFL